MNEQVSSSITRKKPSSGWKWVAGFFVLVAVSRCCEEQQCGSSYASRVAWDSIDTTLNWMWGGR